MTGLGEFIRRGAASEVRSHVAMWLSANPACRRAEVGAFRVQIARTNDVDSAAVQRLAARLDVTEVAAEALEAELERTAAAATALHDATAALAEQLAAMTNAARRAAQRATTATATAESILAAP